MSKVRFVLRRAGVWELLKSEEMVSYLTEKAENVSAAASGMSGLDYAVSPYVGKRRANASVSAASYRAYRENLENNTLLKALGGG